MSMPAVIHTQPISGTTITITIPTPVKNAQSPNTLLFIGIPLFAIDFYIIMIFSNYENEYKCALVI
jgi:hypothetical protein